MKRFLPILAAVVWLGALSAGMGVLMDYDARPGSPGAVPEERTDAALAGRGECIVFLHPKCPCARDTLILLSRRELRDQEAVRIRIVFTGLADADEEWWSGRNRDLAMLVPGADLERDAGGDLARRYGVRTSGHTLVFAADGTLRFSGGIGARPDRAVPPLDPDAVLRGSAEAPRVRPVRGCPLFDDRISAARPKPPSP